MRSIGSTPGMKAFVSLFANLGYKTECLGKPGFYVDDVFGEDYQYMVGNTWDTDGLFASRNGLYYIHVDPLCDSPYFDQEEEAMIIPSIDYLV